MFDKKAYSRKYYKEHKNQPRELYVSGEDSARNKIYYENNKDKSKEKYRAHRWKLRNAFFKMYGESCSCCGETIKEFLTLEHLVKNRGSENSYFSYKNAIKKYDPQRYDVLCMNCNFVTRYGEPCPHKNLQKLIK